MKQIQGLLAALFLFSALASCGGGSNTAAADLGASATPTLEPYVEHHPNGAIKIEGNMLDGERHGPWTAYFENGLKWSEHNYHQGMLNGKHRSYYPDGILRITGAYIDDMKRGEWRFYDEEGKMVKRMDFNQEPAAELEVF